jgi:hypothetical protein
VTLPLQGDKPRWYRLLGSTVYGATMLGLASMLLVGVGRTVAASPWMAAWFPPRCAASAKQAHASPLDVQVRPRAEPDSNWSGYVVTGGPYRAVAGTFTVPRLAENAPTNTQMSQWAGIGGYHSRELVQAGALERPGAAGRTTVQLWWEVQPHPMVPVLPARPGDRVQVTIGLVGPACWATSLSDLSSGRHYSINLRQQTGGSAEWVLEAVTSIRPLTGAKKAIPLAPYRSAARFSQLQVAGPSRTLLAMTIVNRGHALASPSTLNRDRFSVSENRASSTRPQG